VVGFEEMCRSSEKVQFAPEEIKGSFAIGLLLVNRTQ
jgi:hypothetical protein